MATTSHSSVTKYNSLTIEKLSALPTQIQPNTLYLIQKDSDTFDIHLSDLNGAYVYKLNNKISLSDIAGLPFGTLVNNRALIVDQNGKISSHGSITGTDLEKLARTKANIQDQLDGKQLTITGAASSATTIDFTPYRVVITDKDGKLMADTAIDTTELKTLDGINTSKTIQTQLNEKEPLIKGGASTITTDNLVADRVLVSNIDGKVTVSNIDVDELNILAGIPTTHTLLDLLAGKQNTLTGAVTTIASTNLSPNKLVISDQNGKIATTDVTISEVGILKGMDITLPLKDTLAGKQATITGALSDILNSALPADKVLITSSSGKVIASPDISLAELNTLDGLDTTVLLKDALAAKQATITGAASSVVTLNLTADRVVVSDSAGKLAVATDISMQELNTLNNISTAKTIQEQLNDKQNKLTGTLDGLANLPPKEGFLYTSPTGAPSVIQLKTVNMTSLIGTGNVAIPANSVSYSPVGKITETNTQAAVAQVDTRLTSAIQNIEVVSTPALGAVANLTASITLSSALFTKVGDLVFLNNIGTTDITVTGTGQFWLPGSTIAVSTFTIEPKNMICCLAIGIAGSTVTFTVTGNGVKA